MSSFPTSGAQEPQNGSTRVYARRRLERLAYVDFGPDNGGVLLDLGEGGLSFQGVGAVGAGADMQVKFVLPGTHGKPIQATGKVVWSNSSGKGGGLQFVEIADDSRRRLKQWILAGDAPSVSDPGTKSSAKAAKPVANSSETPVVQTSSGQTSGATSSARELAARNFEVRAAEAAAAAIAASLVGDVARNEADGAEHDIEHSGTAKTRREDPPHAAPLSLPVAARPGVRSSADLAPEATSNSGSNSEPLSGPRSFSLNGKIYSTTAGMSGPRLGIPGEPPASASPAAPGPSFRATPFQTQPGTLGTPSYGFAEPRRASALTIVGILAASVGVAAMAALAGLRVFDAPPGSMAGLFTSDAGTAAQTTGTTDRPAADSTRHFQVDVVDANNKRWVLSGSGDSAKLPVPSRAQNGSNAGGSASDASSPNSTSANSASANTPGSSVSGDAGSTDSSGVQSSATGPANPQAAAAAGRGGATFGHFPLQAPHGVAAAAAGSSVTEPLVGNDVVSRVSSFESSEPEVPAAPLRVQTIFKGPVLVDHVDPIYRPGANEQHLEGVVQVLATVGKDGVPRSLRVQKGDPRLVGSALQVIPRWRFRPALLDGQPVEADTIITVTFHLE